MERERSYCSVGMRSAEDGSTQLRMQSGGEDLWLQAEQVAAPIFRRLRTVAEYAAQQELKSHLPVPEAVVSVPCFFTECQRSRLVQAASIGDVTVLCTMNDTTAAALDYGLFKTAGFDAGHSSHLAFVSMGHSASTCSLVHFTSGRAEVVNHAFDEQLGGRDFDRVLFDSYAAKIMEKYRMDVRTHPKARLKVLLSAGTEQALNIECLMDDKDVSFPPLTKADFTALCEPLLKRVDTMVKRLVYTDLLASIDSVEVFGGTTRIPCVQDVLQQAFGIKLSRTLSADTVARGCSIMGAILNPNKQVPYTIVDRAAHPLTYGLNAALSPLYDIPVSTWPITIPPLRQPCPLTVMYEETAFSNDHSIQPQQLIIGQWTLQAAEPLQYSIEVLPDGRLGVVCRTEDGGATTPITVPADSSSCVIPADVLESWCDLEKRLQQVDTNVLAKAETRNAIESMVYDTRPNLEDEKHPVYHHLNGSEKATLLSALKKAEDWLYGEAESANLQDLREKWGELQALFEAIAGPYEKQVRQQNLKEQAAVLQQHIADRLASLSQFLETPDCLSALTENDRADAARFIQNATEKCTALPDPVTDAVLDDLSQLLENVEVYAASLHYKKAAQAAPMAAEVTPTQAEPLALPPTESSISSAGPVEDASLSVKEDTNYARRYEAICSRRGVKCNSGLLKLLLADVPSTIDLSNNFVGPKGAMAVVELVKVMPSVTALNLSGNNLDNDNIHAIVKELLAHPTLTSLDVSDNPISVVAGQTLVKFVTQNPRISKLNVEGTLMMKSQKENLLKLAARNGGATGGASW
eukprot:GGOE01001925.1.p1 GENE.GGOE01001925.1~~GGOE01001925.1.p1  ORF type:complete len:905 (-),score=253.66 GGOE01001925.1:253-2673(-)